MKTDDAVLEQVPFGYCHCRCGQLAPIATQTDSKRDYVKGQPVRFLPGHYARVQPLQDLAGRFWPKVNKDGPIVRPELGPCWLWTGAHSPEGYGVIWVGGRLRPAHQIALELAGWIIPAEFLQVLHLCDNPPCVRPDHLKIGTAQDDADDKVSKGRQRVVLGERNGRTVLDPTQVLEVLALYQHGVRGRGYVALGRQFGVSDTTIRAIISGRTWHHL